ncbi:ABC transporter permease [Rivibacter subsaxonicus]|uniref:Sodium transport system permease protein n=1 Tax=Rivibacter subsaxonicus TaxID=457575 RepID=A0A4Q7VWL5_9BURK|nr:ABC transporter permease [Rivibacter subsaxonicus]RZU00875.1 sodium transport system permease protein [Rivibacter subsaxonicus]
MNAARRSRLAGAWSVLKKELVDALRDRRTLAVVLVSSVAMGPLVLVLLSGLVSSLETRAERRVVVAVGIEHAPTLANFIERQSVTIEPAPADYEEQLRKSRLGDPVLVVPRDFEGLLARGEMPELELVSDSANRQAEAGTRRVERLVDGFNRERGMLALALRGVSTSVLQVSTLHERDLASNQSRAAQFTGMLPFFVIMAVLYGALGAALDTTAGERERGSLEPLLATPASPLAITLGKWGAVASLAMGIALLSVLSFLPAQWLIASETLRSLFQFGLREAAAFLMVLVPLAAALSALMMAVAIRCKSFKEAQANNTIVILAASLLPLVTVFNQGGEQRWFLAVPALAQSTLMNRVLRGEALGAFELLLPLAVAALLTAASLAFIAGRLRAAAAKA